VRKSGVAATDALDEAPLMSEVLQVDRQPVREGHPAIGRYSCIRDDARRPRTRENSQELAKTRLRPTLGQWPIWQMKSEENRLFTLD
jgi:hypothetical protein